MTGSHFPPRNGLVVRLPRVGEHVNRCGNPVRYPTYSWDRTRRPELRRTNWQRRGRRWER